MPRSWVSVSVVILSCALGVMPSGRASSVIRSMKKVALALVFLLTVIATPIVPVYATDTTGSCLIVENKTNHGLRVRLKIPSGYEGKFWDVSPGRRFVIDLGGTGMPIRSTSQRGTDGRGWAIRVDDSAVVTHWKYSPDRGDSSILRGNPPICNGYWTVILTGGKTPFTPGSCLEITNNAHYAIRVRVTVPSGYNEPWPFQPGDWWGKLLADQGRVIRSTQEKPGVNWRIETDVFVRYGPWTYDPTRGRSDGCNGIWSVTLLDPK